MEHFVAPRDDLVYLFRIKRGQFDKTRKNRLRGHRIVYWAPMNVHFVHHFAQRNSRFLQRNVGVKTLPACRIKRGLAEPITQQNQTPVDYPKFRQTDGLGPQIETNETRRCGHGLNL